MVSPSLDIKIEQLRVKVVNFQAGNIRNKAKKWRSYTSDKNILDIVDNGLSIKFVGEPPEHTPFEYPRGKKEFDIIEAEITKLLSKGVIEHTTPEDGEYFSNLFTTLKKDGSYRTILNLKSLNKECDKIHFKMESLKQALHMV